MGYAALNRIPEDGLKSFGSTRTTSVAIILPTRLTDHQNVKHALETSWRKWISVGLVGVTLSAAATAYQPWKSFQHRSIEAIPSAAETLRSVNIDRPTAATTATVVLPATIHPWQTTALTARVSGYLAAWHREIGERVNAGEVLAEIDTPELDQELAEGIALAREAVAAATQAKAERVEAQADLKVAESQLVRAEVEKMLARSQMLRREKLLPKGAITQEEYDIFSRQHESRSADVAAAVSDVARRRANLETRAAIIEVREASARSRQANVERLNELQVFKKIVAPFSGVVTRRAAEVGMLVTAGKEPLYAMEDMSRVRIQIRVPQTYARQTSPGVVASIKLPESTANAVQGTITRVANSVDAASRTMLAEVELKNTEHRFQPGSYAQVTLTTHQDKTDWTISTNTLSMRVEGPHVAIVNDRNQIEIKPVSLGRDLGTRIVVTEGITGHERLVVSPGDDLIDGTQIRVNDKHEPSRQVTQR